MTKYSYCIREVRGDFSDVKGAQRKWDWRLDSGGGAEVAQEGLSERMGALDTRWHKVGGKRELGQGSVPAPLASLHKALGRQNSWERADALLEFWNQTWGLNVRDLESVISPLLTWVFSSVEMEVKIAFSWVMVKIPYQRTSAQHSAWGTRGVRYFFLHGFIRQSAGRRQRQTMQRDPAQFPRPSALPLPTPCHAGPLRR